VSADECLTYALQNRAEWMERGEAIVEAMVQKLSQRGYVVADADDRIMMRRANPNHFLIEV
jgi:hypothetical protein